MRSRLSGARAIGGREKGKWHRLALVIYVPVTCAVSQIVVCSLQPLTHDSSGNAFLIKCRNMRRGMSVCGTQRMRISSKFQPLWALLLGVARLAAVYLVVE